LKKAFIAVLMVALALSMGVAMAQGQKNIVQTITGSGQFSTLAKILQSAGVDKSLNTGGPYTVFAPTNDAFKKVPATTMAALSKDKAKAADVLKYHVVKGKLTSKDLANMKTMTALDGKTLTITKNADGSIMVDGAKVVNADMMCSNGVVHGIDTVLIPK
jgi:uncharacterized surface protein with fasciclin (FAS1) repeats